LSHDTSFAARLHRDRMQALSASAEQNGVKAHRGWLEIRC